MVQGKGDWSTCEVMSGNDESEGTEATHGCTNRLGLAFGEAYGAMRASVHIDTDSRFETF